MPRVKTCQFPLWDSKKLLKRSELAKAGQFCGESVKTGSSYCEKHHDICWKKRDPNAPKVKWQTWGPSNVNK